MTEAVARVPGAWRVVRGPMRRYFTNLAPAWDERVHPDGDEHLGALRAAVDQLGAAPRRVLDVGTGTGAAALWLARRFQDAEVIGVDVVPEMIELARSKGGDAARFAVGDAGAVLGDGPFDLVVHLNCPVMFREVAAAVAAGGTVLVVASSGPRTPFYTSHAALRRGFRRSGLEVVGEGASGPGTWLAARSPSV